MKPKKRVTVHVLTKIYSSLEASESEEFPK